MGRHKKEEDSGTLNAAISDAVKGHLI